ncbi:putative periplasmic binding protein-like I [Rosa chinensis]|uniref:Putative periplasmic binding protein-like I n=1 Tax=Rosa chinensis TaxID=74649 RepID=A0A2P6Q1A5_ROSCH|nr:putative periplasmic binding protein-like I [Rosa chinensis]
MPFILTKILGWFYTRDSRKEIVVAAGAALDLINNVQVQAIIGPESSMKAKFVTDLGDKAQVPIISFSATSPSLWSSYFFRIAQSDSSQVKAISSSSKHLVGMKQCRSAWMMSLGRE